METKSLLKKDWTPTPEAFDKMLGWLDTDREKAGAEYEKIRQKLIKLFKWRNCRPEEDYADITINRVMRRISEEVEASKDKPYLFFHGTALNVLREFWRSEQKHKSEDIENVTLTTESPQQQIEAELDETRQAAKFDCMRSCLRQLPDETRQFIVRYHHGESKKDVRKAMAEEQKVPLNVLRIKACRVRAELEKCADRCVAIKNS
jgi:DNA-directed RNA polymerase specialized sigma24 family protein